MEISTLAQQNVGLLLFILSIMGVVCSVLFAGLIFFFGKAINKIDFASDSIVEMKVKVDNLGRQVDAMGTHETKCQEMVNKLQTSVLMLEREVVKIVNANRANI